LQSLVRRETCFELGNDPDLLPPLLEFIQEDMNRLDRWDSAELMRITIAVDEALRNALFHGNLEVTSQLRDGNDRRFHELARERATLQPYQDRRIRMLIAHDFDESRFVIRDGGSGFDISGVDRPIEPEDLLRPSGRGLLLMKAFMDSVFFNQTGNEVTLIKRRHGDPMLSITPNRGTSQGRTIGPRSSSPRSMVDRCTCSAECTGSETTDGQQNGRSPTDSLERWPFAELADYKRLLDQLYVAVCFVNPERRIQYWNDSAERLTGYSAAEVIGRHCCAVLEHEVESSVRLRPGEECPIGMSLAQDRPVHERSFVRHRDGRRISIDARIIPVRDDDGVVIGAIEAMCDATSSLVAEGAFRQVREAADRDPLTGLANRRCLDRMLFQCLEHVEESGQPLSLIISDLDHFKQINDNWGHVVGDQALVQYATTLQNQCRSIDLVARFGGEEFVVILPGRPLDSAVQIAERHRRSTAAATPPELGQRWLTASFGVAQAAPGETASQLLKRADSALYRAKSLGRDRVEADRSPYSRD
jgi:diguanylate cyclase (GGDEF)-like protein/PAS domain S-box-containing protein